MVNERTTPPRPSDGTAGPDPSALFGGRPLIIASNRGPITFHQQSDGTFTSRKGSGGLVTAVSGIARGIQPIWIAAAMGSDAENLYDREDG